MSIKKENATSAQYAQVGFVVAQQLIAKMEQKGFSKKEIQDLLKPSNNGKIKEIVNSVATQIFGIQTNIWDRQKEKLSTFWKERFNHTIDWSKLALPEEKDGFDVLEYIPEVFTEDDVYGKYAEIFGKDSVWKYYSNIRKGIKNQQARLAGNRLILHKGGQEPDAEHLNKSYDDFYQDGKTYMIPIEGMIAALRYRSETGNMMDVKGLTRFHALDSGGHAMGMCRNGNGHFLIDRCDRGSRNVDRGPREISF